MFPSSGRIPLLHNVFVCLAVSLQQGADIFQSADLPDDIRGIQQSPFRGASGTQTAFAEEDPDQPGKRQGTAVVHRDLLP